MQAVKTVIEQKHILPPSGSGDTQGANKFRQAIIKEISSMTANKITGNLSLTTQFQSFDQNGDNTNNYVSLYSLGNSASPWQLQESDSVQ